MINKLKEFYSGKRVLVTGHTGFKGGWLSHWLNMLQVQEIVGIGLEPDQGPDNLYDQSNVGSFCNSYKQDIRNMERVLELFEKHQPEIVFHLAAQPLVITGYERPLETFETNVMGTANILEAARKTQSVRSLVCVTTDKVYDNRGWHWPFRETDALGDKDPYSASKAAAEMVAKSYMTAMMPDNRPYAMATARGGNVIGGGDWSDNRIIPDIVRSIENDIPLSLRNPSAIRPWQHALELCFGYLTLAYKLFAGCKDRNRNAGDFIGSWNFGPSASDEITVSELVEIAIRIWDKPNFEVVLEKGKYQEAGLLRLDSSKAMAELEWRPILQAGEAIAWTSTWYKSYLSQRTNAMAITRNQIQEFERLISSHYKRFQE